MIKNLATVYSAELEGVDAKLIEIETDLNVGLHAFNIVGLADRALNEAKERVNSALKNCGVKPPNRENRKITINLAPADIRKTGSQYDFAIAIGYLVATKQIRVFKTSDKIFLGELALDGRLRPINGALSVAQMAGEQGFTFLLLPLENAKEASIIKNVKVIPVGTLKEAVQFLQDERPIAPMNSDFSFQPHSNAPDFSEIKGQETAKRALTIAAAGGHNMLMLGLPGVGKSFLSRAFAGILPDLSLQESIEATKIWSAAGLRPDGLIRERPFRAPHQTSSITALIGGGPDPRPGEISLAHRGVLFLDELPEFQKATLEALRQPIETKVINISRAKGSLTFLANFIFLSAMNPCPCGYYGDPEKECKCSAYEIIRYQKKISGPLLDRIDLRIKIGRVKLEELRAGDGRTGDESDLKNVQIRQLVTKTRTIQHQRFGVEKLNSEATSREIQEFVALEGDAEKFLETLEKALLSPRSYYRLLKVARTIADLDEKPTVSSEHLAEAFSYRLKEDI